MKALRNRMSFVFQQYNLFQNMTVMQNVPIAPVKVKKVPRADAVRTAEALLEKVGMADKQDAYSDELSREASSSSASRSPVHWRPTRSSCCWTK